MCLKRKMIPVAEWGASVMNGNRCCKVNLGGSTNKKKELSANGNRQPPTFIQRCLSIVKLIIPPVVLTLLPKCPICLAGYIAIVTGAGVSISTATYLRMTLIIICISSLLYFATNRLISLKRKSNDIA